MNKNFNGKTLSKNYWGIGLDSSDKILLDEIISLGKQPDGCYASDDHFSELLEETRVNTNRRIQRLKKQGRIFVTRVREGKKWKRTIKFISLVESNKMLHTNEVESNKLMEVESNKLMEGKQQIVTGILHYKETPKIEQENDDPRPIGRGDIFEIGMKNTGPEENPVEGLSNEGNEIINISNIDFFPSTDYEKINERKENNIPSIGVKNTGSENNILSIGMKESIPEFLKNGITYNEKTYYPLSLETFHGQRSMSDQIKQTKISQELIKIINKKMNSERKVCMKNKEFIINLGFLSEHKEELSKLDFVGFLTYLNEIDITKEQKKQIRPNTVVIRKYINEVPYYEQSKRDIGYKL
jgi:hypothetical protein